MKKKRKPLDAEKAQRGAAAMARQTIGRKTSFKDKRKDANRKACRGKVQDD